MEPKFSQEHINNSVKNSKYESLKKQFLETKDYLGKEIEPGILDSVIYLNGLGFYTTQSCEGHADEEGLPYAWIAFGSAIEKQQEELADKNESIYWEVTNYARKKANEAIKEKFPENLDSEETNDYWSIIFENELNGHPNYGEYMAINNQIIDEYKGLKTEIESLIKEYQSTERENSISLGKQAYPNINFASIETSSQKEFSADERASIKRKSDRAVKEFEKFLQKKYFEKS